MPPVKISYTAGGVEKDKRVAEDGVTAVLDTSAGSASARSEVSPPEKLFGLRIHAEVHALCSQLPRESAEVRLDDEWLSAYRNKPLKRSRDYQTEEGRIRVVAEFISRERLLLELGVIEESK